MAWQTPKTNWTSADGVRDVDMNRIEGNILELHNKAMVRADLTIVIDPNGNDSTGNGTASLPYATITKALESIPKNFNGKVVELNIGAGSYSEDVTIRGFNGVLRLYSAGIVRIQSLTVDGCKVSQSGSQTNFPKGITLDNGASYVGQSLMYVSEANSIGIKVLNGSTFVLYNTASISNTTSAAIEVSGGSHAYVSTIGGTSNTLGVRATTGGIISYNAINIAATTQSITSSGGRIYSGAQANIPSY